MPAPVDPLLAQVPALLDELRARCEAAEPGEWPEELLLDGYAAALQLEGARRRLRTEALELSQQELELAAQEQQLRTLLAAWRSRVASVARMTTDAAETAASAHVTSPRRNA
ncbi:MAG TPA: hypothetical protein VK506_14675 [Conexibacter sp.]|nr:hypothetical protein [Conexibacter sp.]